MPKCSKISRDMWLRRCRDPLISPRSYAITCFPVTSRTHLEYRLTITALSNSWLPSFPHPIFTHILQHKGYCSRICAQTGKKKVRWLCQICGTIKFRYFRILAAYLVSSPSIYTLESRRQLLGSDFNLKCLQLQNNHQPRAHLSSY